MKLIFASRYPEDLAMDADFVQTQDKGETVKAVTGSYTLIAVILSLAVPALICRFFAIPILPIQFQENGVSVSLTALLLALAAQVVLAVLTIGAIKLVFPKGSSCGGALLNPFGAFARFAGFMPKGRYLTALLLPICLFSVLPSLCLPWLNRYSPSWAHTLAMTALIYGFSRFPDLQEALAVWPLPKGARVRRWGNTTYYRMEERHEDLTAQS